MIAELIQHFMLNTERDLGTRINWRKFKIVMSGEAYRLLMAQTSPIEFRDPERGYDGIPTIFGCDIKIDYDAAEGFAFVSDGLRLTPNKNQREDITAEVARRHERELGLANDSLMNVLTILRFEAYEFRHGTVISPKTRSVKNIMPVDCDKLANLFSAVADCIEKHMKEGVAQ